MSNNDLLDVIASEPTEVVDLTVVRNRAVQLRDHYLLKTEVEERLKQINSMITKIERDELPELFSKAKISSLTVEADGNHPAFIAERTTVYNAKIPENKRQEAFQWFEQQGHGDLIKSVINIIFGMQEYEQRLRVMKLLSDAGVEYYTNESVHHMTLKAFVRTELQAGHIIPMDLLGAYIFDEIKIKQEI
jgi:hypothetical protein